MLAFQWNALRVGDRVVVHDDLDPMFGLHEGAVGLVQTRAAAPSEVAVRLDDRPASLLWPWRHAVHLAPLDTGRTCWRCDAMTGTPSTPRSVDDA